MAMKPAATIEVYEKNGMLTVRLYTTDFNLLKRGEDRRLISTVTATVDKQIRIEVQHPSGDGIGGPAVYEDSFAERERLVSGVVGCSGTLEQLAVGEVLNSFLDKMGVPPAKTEVPQPAAAC